MAAAVTLDEDKPRSLVGAVVVLQATAEEPDYRVYGTTDCFRCSTPLWIGMRTKDAVFSGALPICQACGAELLDNPAAIKDPERFLDE